MVQRRRFSCRGQTMLETILVIVAVIVVAIAFTNKKGPFTKAVNTMMELPGDLMMRSNAEIRF